MRIKKHNKFTALVALIATLVCTLIAGATLLTLPKNTASAAEAVQPDETFEVNPSDNFADKWKEAVSKSINDGGEGGTKLVKVVLETNVVATEANGYNFGADTTSFIGGSILVPLNANIILDLNGYTIDRGLTGQSAVSNGSVITITGGTLTVKDSSTAQTGKITGGNTTGYGGGVYLRQYNEAGLSVDSTFILESGTISNNKADRGGGVFVEGKGFTMYGGTISSSTAPNGGGGVYVSSSTFTMNGGTIGGDMDADGNKSTGSYGGGGVFVTNNGKFKMNDGLISHNTASDYGGGVNATDESFTMNGGTISNNKSEYNNGGGGVRGSGGYGGYSAASFNIYGIEEEDKPYIKTPAVIKDNTANGIINNLSISKINVLGEISDGTEIYVTANAGAAFTTDYSKYNGTEPPSTYFKSDNPEQIVVKIVDATDSTKWEAMLTTMADYWSMTVAESLAGDGNNPVTFVLSDDWTAADANGFGADATAYIGGGLCVPSGANIILDLNGHTIDRGLETRQDDGSVIKVESGGALTLEDSSAEKDSDGNYITGIGTGKITGGADKYGGGVYVNGGTFTMSGGEISDNTGLYGGGVYVNGGTFTMSGGKISGNTGYGGGVYVNGGELTLSGGEISDNTGLYVGTYGNAGGVFVRNSGKFTMSGGKISKNTGLYTGAVGVGGVFVGSGVTFTMSGGEISGNNIINESGNRAGIGGVYVNGGTFTMSGGKISGNKATGSSSYTSWGGVMMYGTFKVSGNPVIEGNTIGDGTKNNLVLYNCQINVTGALSKDGKDAEIWVNSDLNTITNGYSTYNKDGEGNVIDPATYFRSDIGYFVILSENEAQFAESVSIALDANGGTGNSGSLTLRYDVSTTIPENKFTRTGYSFKNWNTKADGSGASFNAKETLNDLSEIGKASTLYAQWTANTYAITYQSSVTGYTGTNPENYTFGGEAVTLNDVSKAGYTFHGWYAEESFDTLITSFATDTEGKTVYAKWTLDKPTVSITNNAASVTYSGSEHTLTASASHEAGSGISYTYVWYKDGQELVGKTGASIEVQNVADSGDYKVVVTATDGTLTAESVDETTTVAIAKANINPSVTLNGWTYGETANSPNVTGYYENAGLTYSYVSADGKGYSGATQPTDAGTYTVTVTVGETDNYNGGTSAAAPFTVSQAALTVTVNNATVIYGEIKPNFTVSYNGFVNGDNGNVVTGTPVYSCDYAAGSPVKNGGYGISVSGLNAVNYAITYVAGTLTVTARNITVTPDAKSSQYGDALATLTAQVGGMGLVSGDTNVYTLETTATTTSGVGRYNITVTGNNANYNVTSEGGDDAYEITKRAITVTVKKTTSVYGEAIKAIDYEITSGTIVSGDSNVFGLSTDATDTSEVGHYNVTLQVNNDNYDITLENGTAAYEITEKTETPGGGDNTGDNPGDNTGDNPGGGDNTGDNPGNSGDNSADIGGNGGNGSGVGGNGGEVSPLVWAIMAIIGVTIISAVAFTCVLIERRNRNKNK